MTKTDTPLNTLISCRVKLTEDQRKTLKLAYQERRNAAVPTRQPNIGGSSVGVVTAYSHADLDRELGISQLTFSDLVNSRDSISLPVVLELQSKLGVTVVDKKTILDAAKSYAEYCFTKFVI